MQTSIATLAQIIPAIFVAFAVFLHVGLKAMFSTKPVSELDGFITEEERRLEAAESSITALRSRAIDRGSLRARHAETCELAASRFYARQSLKELRGRRSMLRLQYIAALYGSMAISLLLSLLAAIELALLGMLFYGLPTIFGTLFLVSGIMALLGIYSVAQGTGHLGGDAYWRNAGLRVHGDIVLGISLFGGMGLLIAAFYTMYTHLPS